MSAVIRRHRVGIYAGTFDPVHAGHIAFALQAIQEAQLDEVIFLPERQPRYKQGSEHFGHRVAMLNRAVRPHRQLKVLELTDRHFSVNRTIPQLQRRLSKAQLVFLVGSDVLQHMKDWPDIEKLLAASELAVGVRGETPPAVVETQLNLLPLLPLRNYVIQSHVPTASSGQVRAALRRRISATGCLPSVQRYALRNWLYTSVLSV